ncbi:hypothetical protein SUDANB176_00840 [Streptomyces sp. enrichment culture]
MPPSLRFPLPLRLPSAPSLAGTGPRRWSPDVRRPCRPVQPPFTNRRASRSPAVTAARWSSTGVTRLFLNTM